MYCGVNWGHGTVLPENMILHTSSTISPKLVVTSDSKMYFGHGFTVQYKLT